MLNWTLKIEFSNNFFPSLATFKEEQRLVLYGSGGKDISQTLVLALPSEELLNQLFNDEEIASTVASWTVDSGGK